MNMNLRINMDAQNGGIRISGGEVRLCRYLPGYNMHNRKGEQPSPLASNFPQEALSISPFSSCHLELIAKRPHRPWLSTGDRVTKRPKACSDSPSNTCAGEPQSGVDPPSALPVSRTMTSLRVPVVAAGRSATQEWSDIRCGSSLFFQRHSGKRYSGTLLHGSRLAERSGNATLIVGVIRGA